MSALGHIAMYKEAAFPVDYRGAEVGQVMQALYRLRSITICGLAGMGKSNLARFIVAHPQVQARYLRQRAGSYRLVHIDCAGLARGDEEDLLDEVAAQLEQAGLGAAPAAPPPAQSARRALKARVLATAPDTNLVLVFDYFDHAVDQLTKSFFNYLAYLRNARPQANLAYIFVTRRPLPYLHELQELLDEPCIIGPLSHCDALASIGRDERRLGATFSPAQREALIACSGGHPGFLKNACELLAAGQVDLGLPLPDACRQLLGSAKIRSLCAELWADMTAEERRLLRHAAGGGVFAAAAPGASPGYLERGGFLGGAEGGAGQAGPRLFSPLFARFVREQESVAEATIAISAVPPHQAHIVTPAGEIRVPLSPKLYALLLALTEARGQVVSNDVLVTRVYPDDKGNVSDAALAQLVKRLREAIDPHVRRMTGDSDYTSVETVRATGHRLTS